MDILKDRYKNKHIILTGKHKIKVSTFLKILSKKLKIKKRVIFGNKKMTGHYTVTPFTYKPSKGKKFVFKSSINFSDGLSQIVDEIKRNN